VAAASGRTTGISRIIGTIRATRAVRASTATTRNSAATAGAEVAMRRRMPRKTGIRAAASRIIAAFIAVTGAADVASQSHLTDTGTSAAAVTTHPAYADGRGVTPRRRATDGIFYDFVYTNDVLANVSGGTRRGVIDQGKLEALFSVELEKLAGLRGLNFFANALQIHNTGRMRRDYVGGINTIAGIEAVPTTRLSELWFEQKLWNDAVGVRFGQLAADVEFFFSDASAMFLQSDWPTIIAVNLPSGGPAYPLSTPGVRLKIEPRRDVSLLLAVYNGDPAGPGPGDEQRRNHHGLNFRVSDAPLVITEAQFRAYGGKEDTKLARTLKLGAWVHFGSFEDKRFADDGTLLADPAGSGVPVKRRRNGGVYAVADQQLYRPPGAGADAGITVFSRISANRSDRNLIDFYVDGGTTFVGPLPGRPHDRFGASVIYARFSDRVRAFDRDQIAFTGMPGTVRDYEANLELTYMAHITRDWTVQPVMTYVWHPSGDATRNAFVVGVRSAVRF
jgi:porin